MGMNVASLSDGTESKALLDINTTPLVGVMLVLVMTLIVTVPVQLHAVRADINSELSMSEPVVHTVSIDFDGLTYWDGQFLANRAAIDAKMREVGAKDEAELIEVHIKPDRLTAYSAVAAVMASAQRNGVKIMGLVQSEPLW